MDRWGVGGSSMWQRGREKRKMRLTAHVFAACQALLGEDLVWSVRIQAHNYFAEYRTVRTINLRELGWSQRLWVGRPLRACRSCRVLIRGDVLLSASLSPTLSQMSTRWKEWRKSSTSVEKRQEWTARTAQCVNPLYFWFIMRHFITFNDVYFCVCMWKKPWHEHQIQMHLVRS